MKKSKEPKPRKKALIAQYEVRTGKDGKLVKFGDDFDDVIVVDMFDEKTMGWSVKDAKKKMGLKKEASDAMVMPYIINTLLIAMQETDWSKVKKTKK